MSENYGLRPEFEKPEDVNLKNCALGGSIILSTGGSIFVSAEAVECQYLLVTVIQGSPPPFDLQLWEQ